MLGQSLTAFWVRAATAVAATRISLSARNYFILVGGISCLVLTMGLWPGQLEWVTHSPYSPVLAVVVATMAVIAVPKFSSARARLRTMTGAGVIVAMSCVCAKLHLPQKALLGLYRSDFESVVLRHGAIPHGERHALTERIGPWRIQEVRRDACNAILLITRTGSSLGVLVEYGFAFWPQPTASSDATQRIRMSPLVHGWYSFCVYGGD